MSKEPLTTADMGAGSSKQADGRSPHVWDASSIGVSHDLADSLQSSNETDASRAQTLELIVQGRVAEELKKLQAQESAALRAAQERIAAAPHDDGGGDDGQNARSRQAVSREVEALRARLDKRKQPRELPESVETARKKVVQCLTENDRRPLDCWREVDAFKEEVRHLERRWVDKVVR